MPATGGDPLPGFRNVQGKRVAVMLAQRARDGNKPIARQTWSRGRMFRGGCGDGVAAHTLGQRHDAGGRRARNGRAPPVLVDRLP